MIVVEDDGRTAPTEVIVDGRYRLGRMLGHGGMGIVHAAHDVLLDRPVALKLVDPERASEDAVRLFQREARALARIRHANVVQIYTLGTHGSLHFFAMEHVAGRDVDALIEMHAARGERMPVRLALDILRQVAGGLDAVHRHDLLHRDVKPSNIVLEASTGRAVLIDFGLARPTVRPPGKHSIVAGTPWYMAPEQAADESGSVTSSRSDLYSLACTAFHMLSGRALFDELDPTSALIAQAQVVPPRLSCFVPALAPLDRVFERALAKGPLDRHATCAAFVDELESAAARVTVVVPPPARQDDRPLHVLFLGRTEGFHRHVEALVRRTLGGAGEQVAFQTVESRTDLVAAIEKERADMILIDDPPRHETELLVTKVRHLDGGADAEILVLVRDLVADLARLNDLGVRALPKPLNLRAAEIVIGRMRTRLAERRRPLCAERAS